MKFDTFEGVEVHVGSRGEFYATVDGEEIRRDTYDGLTRAITEKQRRNTRVKAAELPVVALVKTRNWSSETKVEWLQGVFRGINAHTGDTLLTIDGKKEQYDAPWLLRPDDPALPAIKQLVAERDGARQEARRLEDAVDAALKKHGIQPTIGYSRLAYRDKMAAAAEGEEAVVAKLKGQ